MKMNPLNAFAKDKNIPTTDHSNPSSDEEDSISYKKDLNLKEGTNFKSSPGSSSKKIPHPRKRSGNTYDFKTKWKTEICHFWEMNGYCQFGENVHYFHIIFIVRLCPWPR